MRNLACLVMKKVRAAALIMLALLGGCIPFMAQVLSLPPGSLYLINEQGAIYYCGGLGDVSQWPDLTGSGIISGIRRGRSKALQCIAKGKGWGYMHFPEVTLGVMLDWGDALDSPRVTSILAGTPAAGQIKAGDTVRSVGGKPVRGFKEFMEWLHSMNPGDEAYIGVERKGTALTITVVLERRPPYLDGPWEARFDAKNVREILRQMALGRSHWEVAKSQNVSFSAVCWLELRVRYEGLSWSDMQALSDETLKNALKPLSASELLELASLRSHLTHPDCVRLVIGSVRRGESYL